MELGDALHALGQPAAAQPPAVLILDVHVMVGLRPVHPDKDQSRLLPPVTAPDIEPEDPGSPLIDQCSGHVIPPAVQETSPASRGTI